MREINEYTQEVFRRSEKRIKERKRNRKRILAVCIPLCLVVTVFSVILMPMAVSSIRTKNADDKITSNIKASLLCSFTEVEIQGGISSEYYGKVTDKAVVDDIFSAVYSLFENTLEEGVYGAPQDSDESLSADNYEYKDKTYRNKFESKNKLESASKLNGYSIIFTDEEGSQSVYNLIGNILLDVNACEAVVLSDAEISELLTALGISE